MTPSDPVGGAPKLNGVAREKVAVIGLGYVGLSVALAFGRVFRGTIGFDVSRDRVQSLRQGNDCNGELSPEELEAGTLQITDDPTELAGSSLFVVAVPTPVDQNRRPDLTALMSASEIVGRALRPGGLVVYESTVYPGLTEEVCAPELARISGLRQGVDFKVGYSPERINPGDAAHTFDRVVKVVSGEDVDALNRVASAYDAITAAGVHRASSIKVAEAAKVIENTQRDLNIALMNEIAIICNKLGISSREVLQAAGTKWNFLPFSPGLVGGHCIGVDPYYLTYKTQELGYEPQVVLAGRRINDAMGTYVAQSLVKQLAVAGNGINIRGGRVGILGLTFKENVKDVRNSRVPDIITELDAFGIESVVHDPIADPELAKAEFGIELVDWNSMPALDGLILAVPHHQYLEMPTAALTASLQPGGVVFDVKSVLDKCTMPTGVRYSAL